MSEPSGVALVGPTASGKSAVAHELARRRGDVEIISVDAMGVYRDMDIGTAKPTRTERKEVPYHLLDLVGANEEFTVAEFQRAARSAAAEIAERGHVALYVGGTGLYARAVIDDLDIPARYPEIRAELEVRAGVDLPALYRELEELDPLGSSRIEESNSRRIVRALEVTLGSGRAFSSYGAGLVSYPESGLKQIGLDAEPGLLDLRIEERFSRWMDEGFLEEVRRLAHFPGLSRSARQAVGYKELLRHVEGGEDLERCVSLAITHSRQLARRQRSWFRRDPRIHWCSSGPDAAACLDTAMNEMSSVVRD